MIPFLMAAASSPLFMLAGTALSVAGAVGEAQSRKTEAEYKRDIARVNATIAQQNIDQSFKAEQADLDMFSRQVRGAVGTTKAAAAAAGLDVTAAGETGAQLVTDVRRAGAFKMLQLRHKFELDRRAMKQQLVKATAEGDLLNMQASSINPFVSGLTAGMNSLSSGLMTMGQLQRFGPT